VHPVCGARSGGCGKSKGAGSAVTACRFCGVQLTPQQATVLTVRGRVVAVTCDKHAAMVKSGVQSSAVFLHGALVNGARYYVEKKAPGLWGAAAKALGTYRGLTSPE